MVDIAVGVSALKAAYDITKGLKDINDRVKLNAAIIELQEKILAGQEATSEARDQLRQLEAELAVIKQWEATAARYALRDYGGNTFAYELREDRADREPIHRLCPNCFEDRKRGILQFQFRSDYGQDRYECSICKCEFSFGSSVQATSRRPSTNYDPLG